MSDLITGDAVVVELRLARLASRSVAFAIDLAVMLVGLLLLLALFSVTGALGEFDPAFAATVGLIVMVSVFIVYPVTIETLTRGRSLGKKALGLRVVRDDGGPIRFRHALARGLAGFIVDFGVLSAGTGAIGLISSLASAQGRRIGDMLAGTVVIHERVPTAPAVEILMPPPLAGWATSLSLSQLPDPLALRVRQFLQRLTALDPQVRSTLGHSLAAEVAACTSPPPPPGTRPDAYLAAVLAERRRREGERLAAQRSSARAPADPGPVLPALPLPDPGHPLPPFQPAPPPAPQQAPHAAQPPPDPGDGGFAVPR